jgi:hypothetical protein
VNERTDLMKHERLAMEPERDPFGTIEDDGVSDVHLDHVPLSGSVVERSLDGEVVEVAVANRTSSTQGELPF